MATNSRRRSITLAREARSECSAATQPLIEAKQTISFRRELLDVDPQPESDPTDGLSCRARSLGWRRRRPKLGLGRQLADFETVKWIYLRKTGETAAYQL